MGGRIRWGSTGDGRPVAKSLPPSSRGETRDSCVVVVTIDEQPCMQAQRHAEESQQSERGCPGSCGPWWSTAASEAIVALPCCPAQGAPPATSVVSLAVIE